MRITCFASFVNSNCENMELQKTSVVIDGQNYFYDMYKDSMLPFELGCESDKFAKYLRKHLLMYQNSQVQCHIFFKGGHENIENHIEKRITKPMGNNYTSIISNEIVIPIFVKDIYKQIISEMQFDHVICETEAKEECIAYAQKCGFPIISFDVEFSFSGVPYIPKTTIVYDDKKKSIKCNVFKLDNFCKKFKVNDEKLALFITLTDERIFPDGYFNKFFHFNKIPTEKKRRFVPLLKYLSLYDKYNIMKHILRHTETLKEGDLESSVNKASYLINQRHVPNIPQDYLNFKPKDPLWFKKGVAGGYIPIDYINLYKHKIFLGSWAIEDNNAPESVMLSIKIIQYAYGLLTNFAGGFTFVDMSNKRHQIECLSVMKPVYHEVQSSVFENGWVNIGYLKLFEHFLKKSFTDFDFAHLQKVHDDMKLVILALAYFSQAKGRDVSAEMVSVLLSCAMLSDDSKTFPVREKDRADQALKACFTTSAHEISEILDRKLIHPLVEFQFCLKHLNYLNKLCGSLYKSTDYAKTYNGTFVFKVLFDIKRNYDGDYAKFLMVNLNSAPSVGQFVKNMLNVCNSITNCT